MAEFAFSISLKSYNGRNSRAKFGSPGSGSRGLGSRPGLAIVLCSWAKHFTRTMPLSTWECKWVPANFKENMIGNAEGGGGGAGVCGIASHLIELAVILVDKHKHRLYLFVNSYNIT